MVGKNKRELNLMVIKLKKLLLTSLVVLLALTGFATTASASPLTSNSKVSEVSVGLEGLPRQIYIENHSRSFSKDIARPPTRVHHSELYEGVRYSGYLTLTDFADAGTRWLALYSGYISR
jgi:hypothetical protein